MVCKMLFFDYRESEKNFFEKNKFPNLEIKFFNESLNEETVSLLEDNDFENAMIISVFVTSNITENIVNKFKNLRIISTRSTGYDHIELNHCLNKNIALINVESYGNTSVSQFTFALILMLVRQILPAIESVKLGVCTLTNFTGRNLNTMTIGVIGTGATGAGVCQIASGLNMNILAFDTCPKKELEQKYNVKYVNLEELLKTADIVTLHLPYTKETYHFMKEKQFKSMKEGSFFINVSRGELVNLEDLLSNLKNGKIKGAGLDVVACVDSNCMDKDKKLERTSLMCLEDSKVVRELNTLPNVIITPHIAYDTHESMDYILKMTFEGIRDFLCGGNKNRVL